MFFDSVFTALTSRLKRKEIKIGADDYLTRYYLYEGKRYAVYLHRFVAGDKDRRVHDHPWKRALAIVLSGSYTEERSMGNCPHNGPITRLRRIRFLNYLDGLDFHRIVTLHSPVVWTLFMRQQFKRHHKWWGFAGQVVETVPVLGREDETHPIPFRAHIPFNEQTHTVVDGKSPKDSSHA